MKIAVVFDPPYPGSAPPGLLVTCTTAMSRRVLAWLGIRLTAGGEVRFLEANANPFISWGHDMANSAEKAGMNYPRFIQRIVDEAMARRDPA